MFMFSSKVWFSLIWCRVFEKVNWNYGSADPNYFFLSLVEGTSDGNYHSDFEIFLHFEVVVVGK